MGNLIDCEDCGAGVSLRAANCPHCGGPMFIDYGEAPGPGAGVGKPARFGTGFSVGCGVTVAILVVIGVPAVLMTMCVGAAKTVVVHGLDELERQAAARRYPYAGTITYPAEQLVNSYRNDPGGSGRAWDDKKFAIRGRLDSLANAPPGPRYVLIKTITGSVRCQFDKKFEAEFSALSVGTSVVIGGVGAGFRNKQVRMIECRVPPEIARVR